MSEKSKKNKSAAEGAYRFGEFHLYPSERKLEHRNRAVPLSPKVFDALLLFVRNAEHLVRRDELIETLWPDTYVTDANLTNVIVSLRKTLGREAIQTVSKFGYRFCMPVLGEPGVDQAMYTMFLQGKDLAKVRSLESMARARDLFALCVASDPQFAAAWAWLGRCHRFLYKFNPAPSANMDLAEATLKRALAIDPDLACAHNFYTHLQVDLGQSQEVIVRLAQRIAARGGEPESFAGLVQGLRFCGLLDESILAHTHATALDPTIVTSVPHTYFLHCEYETAIESYTDTRYYLDAASWAALGDTRRATELLSERLRKTQLSVLMSGLMGSLLAVLEGKRGDAADIMKGMQVEREPEVVFYLARHFAMLNVAAESIALLQRARTQGLSSSYTLMHDAVFDPLRKRADFQRELDGARAREKEARVAFDRAGGRAILS
jgi:tetratricopeptide (TPR) repeat protein